MTASIAATPTLRRIIDALRAPIADPAARGRRAAQSRLAPRERRAETLAATTFLAVACAMAAFLEGDRPIHGITAVVLVAAYALVRQVRFDVGAGFAVATQLVLVPMLILLPPDVLPLMVAAGSLLGTLIDVVARGAHPERTILAVANAWFAVGPALVLALAPASVPAWIVYVAAFAAQLGTDLAASTAREWLCSAIPPHFQARVIGLVAIVDALLWPVGLLTALAAQRDPLLSLLVLPLAALLGLVAHERTARLQQVRSQTSRFERATSRIGQTFASGLDREATLALALDTAIDVTDAATGRVTHPGSEPSDTPAPGTPAEVLLHEAERLALETCRGVTLPDDAAPTALAAPMRADAGDRERVAVLSVARPGRPFSDDERERFHALARQAEVSMDNVARHERLARQATTDELTGLLNHRRLHEVLRSEIASSPRFRPSVSLVMLDIDDFKAVNDTHGHQCGDEVLFAVARAVEGAARQGDHVARYGGEELAVVLPNADLAQAHRVAERIRQAIERVAVPLAAGGSVRPTASLGVAALASGVDKEALIAAADAALYEAKRGGKNRTVCASLLAPVAAGV